MHHILYFPLDRCSDIVLKENSRCHFWLNRESCENQERSRRCDRWRNLQFTTVWF